MNAAEIRELYPDPMTYEASTALYEPERGYCVGGALGFMLGFEDGFPTTDDVGMYLEMATEVDEDVAKELAEDITTANDAGEFNEAWDALDRALAWGDVLA